MGRDNSIRVTIYHRLGRAGLVAMLLLASAAGLAYEPRSTDYQQAVEPALGISEAFGRWNSQINLVYDPDGAPPMFSNPATVLNLLEEAAAQWSLVSGIQINVTGADSNAANDDNRLPNRQDGLVRVFWDDAGGAAGVAGPNADFYDEDLGYYPFIDGSVEINADPELWQSGAELVSVLVHELGHLIGLGHSDNPDSVMFANPYNHLNHPRADDILAARAMYGNGTLAISDITQPVSQWLYSPPPQAPAGATISLFRANGILDQGALIGLAPDQPLAGINAQTQDGTLWFYFASGPSGTGNIDIDATIAMVDPFGYLYEARQYSIECEKNFSCYAGATIGDSMQTVKSVPGEWTLYIIDNDTNMTLHEFSFAVDTTSVFNQPPTAEDSVSSVSNTTVNVSVDVSDTEDDNIEVIWHPQGNFGTGSGISDSANDGDSVSRDITFLSAETHTLFIELRDDASRYTGGMPGTSNAGAGFRNLIAMTVDLPVFSSSDVAIRKSFKTADSDPDSGNGNGGALTGQVLVDTIAETSALELITASDGSTSTARFGAGASSDAGVSTNTVFTDGNEIVIAGSVSPQADDIGQAGEIYVVLYTSESLSYMNLDGNYNTWNGSLKSIQPAFERDELVATESFELYSGAVQSGLYRIFMGYSLTEGEGGPIHFNAKAFRVNVE